MYLLLTCFVLLEEKERKSVQARGGYLMGLASPMMEKENSVVGLISVLATWTYW